MRFIQNGPNIPDDLLLARDEGESYFLVWDGAEVSTFFLAFSDALNARLLG